jgi:hypothetical protein
MQALSGRSLGDSTLCHITGYATECELCAPSHNGQASMLPNCKCASEPSQCSREMVRASIPVRLPRVFAAIPRRPKASATARVRSRVASPGLSHRGRRQIRCRLANERASSGRRPRPVAVFLRIVSTTGSGRRAVSRMPAGAGERVPYRRAKPGATRKSSDFKTRPFGDYHTDGSARESQQFACDGGMRLGRTAHERSAADAIAGGPAPALSAAADQTEDQQANVDAVRNCRGLLLT